MPRALLLVLALASARPASARAAAMTSPAGAEPVPAVVSRVVRAYGGHAALQRVRVVRQEGTVTSRMRGEAGRLLRIFQAPDRLRVEIAYPTTGPEVRVVQGPHGRRGAREVSGPMHAAMVLQAARLALPLSLAAPAAHLADGGTIERDGRARRVLVQSLPDGMELRIEVDPASARIVRTVGSLPSPGGPIEFATEYSAFRTFAGVLFATHEESWARGQHTGSTDLARVQLLPEAPPGAFDEAL